MFLPIAISCYTIALEVGSGSQAFGWRDLWALDVFIWVTFQMRKV